MTAKHTVKTNKNSGDKTQDRPLTKANSILGAACRQDRHTATDRKHGCPMVDLLGQSFHVYSFLSLINSCHSALSVLHLASLTTGTKPGITCRSFCK